MARNDRQKLKYCAGCRDNFYNGNNGLGIKRCWHLKDAKVVFRKLVHVDHPPPWNQKAKRVLGCFNMRRYVCIDPKRTC